MKTKKLQIKITKKLYFGIIFALFLILLFLSYIFIIGVPVKFETDREYQVEVIGKDISEKCVIACQIRIPLGKHDLKVSRDGFFEQIFLLDVNFFGNNHSLKLIEIPNFFLKRMFSGSNVSDIGWIGPIPVYVQGNEITSIEDTSMVFRLLEEDGQTVWDQYNQLVGYLGKEKFWMYDNTYNLKSAELEKDIKTNGDVWNNKIAFFEGKDVYISTLPKGRRIKTLTLPNSQTVKEVVFEDDNTLLIITNTNKLLRVDLSQKETSFETVFEKNISISKVKSSSVLKNISFLTEDYLVILSKDGQELLRIQLEDQKMGKDYVWISDHSIILFEKIEDYRTIDHIYFINLGAKEKEFINTTIAMKNRIDFNFEPRISLWEKKIIVKEKNGPLWLISLDSDDIQDKILKAKEKVAE